MVRFFKRNIFFHINKFQKHLLYPVLVSCFLGCVVVLLCLDYFYFDQSAIIYDFSFSHLKMLAVWLLPVSAFLLLVVGIIIYLISNRILGPYGRIIREVDNVLTGKTRRHLHVRKGDEMFGELIIRINALIDKLP